MLCTRPKKIVRNSTQVATQKVYHCTPLRLSNHLCEMFAGRDWSKACFNMISRSCQNRNLSICRSSSRSAPQLWTAPSNLLSRVVCLLSHFWVAQSCLGKSKARVRSVSSLRPSGNRVLSESATTLRDEVAALHTSCSASRMRHDERRLRLCLLCRSSVDDLRGCLWVGP